MNSVSWHRLEVVIVALAAVVLFVETLLILRPDPGSFLNLVPVLIAGMVGAFAGMGVFFAIDKSRQKRKSNAANK